MLSKIQITGEIELVTGMHIGGSEQFAAIGAVDSPVIRDTVTNKPIIPGSSIKGKMRTLLAKQFSTDGLLGKPNDDDERILRLFGSSKEGAIKKARLLFSDMVMTNSEELRKIGVSETEVKFENAIDRITSVANPRQIERTVRGAKFDLNLIYDVFGNEQDKNQIIEDFNNIVNAFKLLEYDYLGGNGSRGYGKVKFSNLEACCVVGNVEDAVMDRCNEVLGRL